VDQLTIITLAELTFIITFITLAQLTDSSYWLILHGSHVMHRLTLSFQGMHVHSHSQEVRLCGLTFNGYVRKCSTARRCIHIINTHTHKHTNTQTHTHTHTHTYTHTPARGAQRSGFQTLAFCAWACRCLHCPGLQLCLPLYSLWSSFLWQLRVS
jgi:hypothetical protein